MLGAGRWIMRVATATHIPVLIVAHDEHKFSPLMFDFLLNLLHITSDLLYKYINELVSSKNRIKLNKNAKCPEGKGGTFYLKNAVYGVDDQGKYPPEPYWGDIRGIKWERRSQTFKNASWVMNGGQGRRYESLLAKKLPKSVTELSKGIP